LNKKTAKAVIFSDLDGTLLDEKYSFDSVSPIIARLVSLNVPIVLCSSKTRTEIEYYRKKLGIDAPFVSENGAAIIIPRGYFKRKHSYAKQTEQYDIVEIGIAYSLIRRKLARIKKMFPQKISGFGDMNAAEIASSTGLTIELAELAKQREYSEPFRYYGEQEKEGLRIIKGGKFNHLVGNHDKGKAVLFLRELYSEKFGHVETFGVGNQSNDVEMLEVVGEPFFIANPEEMKPVWENIINFILNMAP
jgi:mannosyl-3-phosphoglycerate phosphatase